MNIKLLFAFFATLIGTFVSAQDVRTLYLENITGTPGTIVEAEVSMNNVDLSIIAFQCDVVLPSNVEVMIDEYGDADVWTTSRTAKHTVSASIIKNEENAENFILRVVCYSDKNRIITGSDGSIFGFRLKLGEEIGEYPVNINQIYVTDNNRVELNDFTCAGSTITIMEALYQPSISVDSTRLPVYDIMGRSISNPSHGLYIHNGKKIIIK